MLDERKLQKALQATNADILLNHYANNRTKDAKTTTVDLVTSLKKPDGSPVSRGEAVRSLKALAEAGCGRFVSGRRGRKTRLEWGVSAIETARKATHPNGAVDREKPTQQAFDNGQTYEFKFPLRRDFEVRMEIPADLDSDERERLAKAISALPVI